METGKRWQFLELSLSDPGVHHVEGKWGLCRGGTCIWVLVGSENPWKDLDVTTQVPGHWEDGSIFLLDKELAHCK